MRKTRKIFKRNFTKRMGCNNTKLLHWIFFDFFLYSTNKTTLLTFCSQYRLQSDYNLYYNLPPPPQLRLFYKHFDWNQNMFFYFLPKGKPAYQIIQMIIIKTCYHKAIFGKCLLYQTFDDILGLDIIDLASQHKLNVSPQ